MIFYLGISIITLLLAGLVQERQENRMYVVTKGNMISRVAFYAIFVLLFGVSFLRYYVGNDYGEYLLIFQKIYNHQQVSSEVGFNLVVKFFQWFLGPDTFIPIFGFFSFFTVFFMLKAVYDQSDWFWYGFFLFTASGYYLSGLNTVRYYFAFAIAVYAAKYAIKKDWIPFLLWILLAATVHKTVLVVIPIYWFATRKWRKTEIGIITVFCISLLLFQDFYREIIFRIYPYYENSRFDTNTTSYLNILKCACILIFSLIYYKQAIRDNEKNRFYFYLNFGGLLLYSLCSFIPEVSRIGYYLVWSQMFLLPNVLVKIENKKQKVIFSILIGLAFLLYFAMFLYRAGGVDLRIVPYQTWIFGGLQ